MLYNYHTLKSRTAFVVSVFLFLSSPISSLLATTGATLVWDQNSETDVAGYRLYYGTSSGSYTQVIDVGNVTTATVSNLQQASTYFFVVTAYSTSNVESAASSEICYNIAAPRDPLPPTANPSPTPQLPLPQKHLFTISTRSFVQANANVVERFIVSGNTPKEILLRGIGPSLSNMGITSVITNVTLELRSSAGVRLAFNTSWTTAREAILPTGLAPSDDRESAILSTLPPGAYSAILRGANGSSGVALLELYDLDPNIGK